MRSAGPNILLIVMDSARADRLSSYGYDRPTTPNLDRFTKEAVRYSHAYAPAIWTLPAMTSLFTGLYPVEHGVHTAFSPLRDGSSSLVRELRRAGYQSGAFVTTPWSTVSSLFEFDTMKRVGLLFDTNAPQRWHTAVQRLYWLAASRRDDGAAGINRNAMNWLDEIRGDKAPFFMYLHYMEPHGPYTPPRRTLSRFLRKTTDRRTLSRLGNCELAYIVGKTKLDEEDLDTISDLYDAELAYLDEMLGQLFARLEATGVLDETMIIVTADHGENLGEKGLIGHQYCLYDTLLHVPLLIRYPATFTAGTTVSQPVQSHDIMATIADVLGVEEPWQPEATRWQSLRPDRLVQEEGSYTFAQYLQPLTARFDRKYPSFDYRRLARTYHGIRDHRYKLILDSDGEVELYDYLADPAEEQELAALLPEVAARLRLALEQWLQQIERGPVADEREMGLDPITAQRLRDLGYL